MDADDVLRPYGQDVIDELLAGTAPVTDDAERERAFAAMVERMYEHGKALNVATHFEIDDVIDPADSRRWISAVLGAAPAPAPRVGKKRPNVDTW